MLAVIVVSMVATQHAPRSQQRSQGRCKRKEEGGQSPYVQRPGSGGELMCGPKPTRQYFEHGVATNRSAVSGEGTLSAEPLQALARRHAGAYSAARPFKHIVIDNFLPESLSLASMHELQAKHESGSPFWKTRTTRMGLKRGRGGYPENADGGAFGPATAKLFDFFQSARFVAFLETLTGIRNLVTDVKLFGGGPFSIINGGFLSLHTDFNKHMSCTQRDLKAFDRKVGRTPSPVIPAGCRVVTPGWRRINVLLYLNQDWREPWGGAFELWQTDQNYSFLDYHTKVVPQLNRLTVFSVTDISIHGHLDEINHPQGETRKSLSFYYYTPDVDDEPLITHNLHESIYMPGHAVKRSTNRWREMVPRYIIR